MRLQAMVGYKLFKELEDNTIELIRIVHVRKYEEGNPSEIKIKNEGTGEIKKVRVDSLKDFKPLEPDGLLTFNIATIRDEKGKANKDVIVTASKFLNLKIGDTLPYAVCRQSITDIFHNLLVADESEMMVGLSINQDNCPANFNFPIMLAADGISYSDHINFYRTDTVEDLLSLVKVSKFDEVLQNLYSEHVKVSGNPNLIFKDSHDGWCKSLTTLLTQNNFQHDINEMLGITDVMFNIADFLEEKELPGKPGETYQSPTEDLIKWLSSIYKVNINYATAIEYNHDINLGDFNNSKYLLIRDSNKVLWMIVYTTDGEYHEADLIAKDNEKDFSTQFRINFYDKYNHLNNNSSN